MYRNILKHLGLGLAVSVLFIAGCKPEEQTPVDFKQLETEVLSSFVSKVGTPCYTDFKANAEQLNAAVLALVNNPNSANQKAAQDAWKAVRVTWEFSEGFLIGPVEDNNYDPYMDTWPTDRNEMDQLLAGIQPLDADALGGFTNEETQLTLRGFHPLEYLLWKSNTNYSNREKEYMQGLSQDILNNVVKLNNDWPAYTQELMTPGGTSRYTTKQDALLAIANAFAGICGEVSDGKMLTPFNANPPDSTLAESPYSHNSLTDFKNNILGAYNVYLCKYNGTTGKSMSDLVAANNKTLDQNIKAKFEAAINSFDNITVSFEQAIYTQRTAVQNTIDAINNLKAEVETPLTQYIQQYVKD